MLPIVPPNVALASHRHSITSWDADPMVPDAPDVLVKDLVK